MDEKAIVKSMEVEIETREARVEELRNELEEEQRTLWRVRSARRDLVGGPSPRATGGQGLPRSGVGPNADIYAPGEEITEPILEFMKKVGHGVTNVDLVDAGLASSKERAADYLNRMHKYDMLRKGGMRQNPKPGASRPYQEYELP